MVNRKKAITPYYVVTILLLAVMAVFFLFPLYWIVTGSVKIKSDIIIKSGEMVKWIPTTISWDNFARLFKSKTEFLGMGMPMAIRWLFNSVFISVVAMVLTCITASLAGYVLGKRTDIRTVRVRHGAAKTGNLDSSDEGNVGFGAVKIGVGLHVRGDSAGGWMAVRRVYDEAVFGKYSKLAAGGGPH